MLQWLQDIFRLLTDVEAIIRWGGTLMVCIIVFTETGLFFGFFLPGDSLLVTAGIFAAAGYLNLWTLLGLGSLCAVIGDQVNYYVGRSAGHALYNRPDSRFFKRKHLERAHEFYEKYGGKTIVFARFVPIVRTFAPAVAGAAEMSYWKFVSYNFFGGVLWVCGMVLLGYFLGKRVPNINQHIHWVIAIVIFVSILPGIFEFWRSHKKSRSS